MKFDDFKGLIDYGYVIRLDAVSELTLSYLMTLAEKVLAELPQTDELRNITVVITDRDNIYTGSTVSDESSAALIRQLTEQDDTYVTHLVTVFPGPALELPSYTFRQMLLELNEKNANALMVLQGHECLRARTIGSTMPAKKTSE